MKTNLKDNIWVEGFNTERKCDLRANEFSFSNKSTIIYVGKTSEIPEEIAKEYFDYGYDNLELHYTSIDEAIKEVCNQEYCIIFKTK